MLDIVEYCMVLMNSEFRSLPGVDRVLSDEQIRQLAETYPHSLLVNLVRKQLESARLSITNDNPCPSINEIVESICTQVYTLEKPAPRNKCHRSNTSH